MSEPQKAELYISRLNGADEGKRVRIEARDGAKLLGRIDVDITGFAEAVMGLGAVPCTFATKRQQRA